jgi:hypothetical protein
MNAKNTHTNEARNSPPASSSSTPPPFDLNNPQEISEALRREYVRLLKEQVQVHKYKQEAVNHEASKHDNTE